MYVGSLLVSLRLTSLVPLSWSRVTLERLVHMVLAIYPGFRVTSDIWIYIGLVPRNISPSPTSINLGMLRANESKVTGMT